MPFTDAGRELARQNSKAQRQRQQRMRHEQVKKMHDAGMSKTAIANELGVSYRTIWKDLKESQ